MMTTAGATRTRWTEGLTMAGLALAMVVHSVCLSLEQPVSALASLWSDHFAVQVCTATASSQPRCRLQAAGSATALFRVT